MDLLGDLLEHLGMSLEFGNLRRSRCVRLLERKGGGMFGA